MESKTNLSNSNCEIVQYLKVTGDRVRVAHKYDSLNDIWIDFMKVGPNSLMGLSHFFLARNENAVTNPDLDRKSELFFENCSDWIGPYIMKAISEPDCKSDFTGGWHGTNGAINMPTARTLDFKVYADGVEAELNKVIPCKKTLIIVENNIQAANTLQDDGKGREVLKEIVHYEISMGRHNVDVDIEALEDISIFRYYGLQTINNPWFGELTYESDKNDRKVKVNSEINSSSGSKRSNPNVNTLNFIRETGNHRLTAWLDRDYCLGKMESVPDDQPCAFTCDYGKSYFNLVNSKEKILKKGEQTGWRGYYLFNGCL